MYRFTNKKINEGKHCQKGSLITNRVAKPKSINKLKPAAAAISNGLKNKPTNKPAAPIISKLPVKTRNWAKPYRLNSSFMASVVNER